MQSFSETFDRVLQQIITTVIFILFLIMMFRKVTQKEAGEEEAADEVDGPIEPDQTMLAGDSDEHTDEDVDDHEFEADQELHEEEEEEIAPSAPRIIIEADAQSTTESEILIEDEMHKQLNKCTCSVPLRMHRLGGGKYRISGSKRVCLVRILTSVVMVRVGGGWVPLEEFLIKHDPCRAKLLSMPASSNAFTQEMMSFKPKRQHAK